MDGRSYLIMFSPRGGDAVVRSRFDVLTRAGYHVKVLRVKG